MIVKVKQGSLFGKKCSTVLGKKPYLSFSGIPYAMAPTGDLRFQAPKPIHRWEGIYNATHERGVSPQKAPVMKSIIGSEDCLYLNVYAPEVKTPMNAPKSVMVYIHGGSFCTGSGTRSVYGPDFLLDYDVVVVTVNYRLQMLGIPECPGNVGLKDQIMALRWIKDNISSFGGDPNNITLFGESAGATCVHLLAISPLCRGLFHKAILQSGFCLSSWALAPNPLETAFELGRRLGYFGHDRVELLNHFKSQSAKDLIKVGNQLKKDLKVVTSEARTSIFAPSVEFIREGAVLPEHPAILQRTAPPMPMIWGCTDLEGLLGLGLASKKNLEIIYNDLSMPLKKNFNIDPERLPQVASEVQRYYFNGVNSRKSQLQAVANFFTDFFFYNFEDSLQCISGSCFPPFVYEFCYTGKMNSMKKFFSMKIKCELDGACHGDELDYLFYHKHALSGRNFNPADLKVVHDMCSMWSNFAKFGNPSQPMWRPYTTQQPCYLKIRSDLQLVNGTVRGARPQILRNILAPYTMKMLTD